MKKIRYLFFLSQIILLFFITSCSNKGKFKAVISQYINNNLHEFNLYSDNSTENSNLHVFLGQSIYTGGFIPGETGLEISLKSMVDNDVLKPVGNNSKSLNINYYDKNNNILISFTNHIYDKNLCNYIDPSGKRTLCFVLNKKLIKYVNIGQGIIGNNVLEIGRFYLSKIIKITEPAPNSAGIIVSYVKCMLHLKLYEWAKKLTFNYYHLNSDPLNNLFRDQVKIKKLDINIPIIFILQKQTTGWNVLSIIKI